MTVAEQFRKAAAAQVAPSAVELGARRAGPTSTLHKAWVPHAREWIGADVQAGVDVDLVVDVHRLADTCGDERFDILVTDAGMEHFKYPFVAAHQIMRTLKVGGLLYVRTHQSYPLHACPYDFFRFSAEAMVVLFSEKMGMQCVTEYEYPAQIHAAGFPGVEAQPSYLCVTLFGQKTAATPRDFIYTLDDNPTWPSR
jgi:hypothetical protein